MTTPTCNDLLKILVGTDLARTWRDDVSDIWTKMDELAIVNGAASIKDTITKTPTKIIDDATFSTTVSSTDIDVSNVKNGLLTVSVGTMTTTPSLTAKIQVKDSNENYIDYLTLPVVTTSSTTTFDEFFNLAAKTIKVVCTYAGTGNFANVTVELTTF